jgi:hypothetical protein
MQRSREFADTSRGYHAGLRVLGRCHFGNTGVTLGIAVVHASGADVRLPK